MKNFSALLPFLLLLSFGNAGAVTVTPDTLTRAHLDFRDQANQRARQRLDRFLAAAGDTLATTAAEVLARHVAAVGGRSAWAGIETLEIRYRLQGTGGEQLPFVRQYKQPNLFRQGVRGGPVTMVSDGTRVWRVRRGQWQEIEPDGTQHFASMDDHMLDPAATGTRYAFVGVEMLNHAPVYHLQRRWADGSVEELYFSITSGRLQERFSDYLSGPSYLTYWNYRQVGDIWLPHVFMRSVGDFGPPHGAVIEEVLLNPDLPDSLFQAP